MIDLHSHILPNTDDGAGSLSVSLDMARMSVEDGVKVLAATPHILPGVYHNTGEGIRQAVDRLQDELDRHGIALRLISGADIHVAPGLPAGFRSGTLPTLAGSRYALIEPPHNVVPPRMDEVFFGLIVAGIVPILTHPERLSWIEGNYGLIQSLAGKGVWMQVTAGSLLGAFGRNPRYWAERMLDEGLVHILATDAHDVKLRPPCLGRGRDAAAKRVGSVEAEHLVLTRPMGVLENARPTDLPAPAGSRVNAEVGNEHEETRAGETGAGPGFADRGAQSRPGVGGWLTRGLRRFGR